MNRLPPAVVKLFHRDLGGAGRPPLVILHGLLGSSRNWQTAGTGLANPLGLPGGGFHVCALDLRNHGRSPHAPEMDYAAMTEDVLGWLDAQGWSQAAVLGHSLGGKVAMMLACRQPERVGRLIVVDIAPKDYHTDAHRAEFAAMNALRLETLHSRAEAERQFEAQVPNWAMRKFLATNLERGEDGRWQWQINLPALTAALPALEKNPLAAAERYPGPALFITGGKSRYVQPEDHAAIRRHFPEARISTIAASGHNPHIEAGEELIKVMTAAG